MTRLSVFALAVALFGGSTANSQTITVTPKTSAVPHTDPNKRYCYAEGTYTLMMGQTVEKVVVSWYKQESGGNLTHVVDSNDLGPAAGNYKTGNIALDVRDNGGTGAKLKYTVIAKLYIQGQATPVGSGSYVNFMPN